jgi:hypothetical protein
MNTIGTQQVLDPADIGPPDYELLPWLVEETIDCLLDQAVRTGEEVSQGNIARGRGPAPYAHRACTSYHAIEVIRWYEQQLDDLRARYNQLVATTGPDA